MKKVLLTLAAFIMLQATGRAQNARIDEKGNYVTLSTKDTSKQPLKATGKTFTDSKGKTYPVYISKNGKLFYIRTSKAGNTYPSYIKL